MNRYLGGLALAGTVATLIAGCSSGPNKIPLGNTTTTNTSANTAPKVAHPLDATRFLNSTCSALTAADIAALGLQDPLIENSPKPTGPGCAWQGVSAGDGVGIDWLTKTDNSPGIAGVYQSQANAFYFQPTTVSGYPAVYADYANDARPNGDCTILVGVNDQLVFNSNYDGQGSVDAATGCARAKQAAADVIKNLGGS